MIGRVVLFSALMSFAGATSAQEACTFYKVNTSLLNISKEAGGDIDNDPLFDGDIDLRHAQGECEGRGLGIYRLQAGKRERAHAGRRLVGDEIPPGNIRGQCRLVCGSSGRRGAGSNSLPLP